MNLRSHAGWSSSRKIERFSLGKILLVFFSGSANLFFSEAYANPPQSVAPQVTTGPKAYSELLQSLDLYASPPAAKKLLTLAELYQLVQEKGIALKVSRETLNAAKQESKTEKDKKIPILNLELGHDQAWAKKRIDSDLTDEEVDRKHLTGTRSVNSKGGFSLTGAPIQGVSYRLFFPQLTHAHQQPKVDLSEPERPDSGGVTGSVDVALLKDNPFLVESLASKKRNMTLSSAREAFRSETLKKLHEAESSYYGLIQKYLQLTVQERSLRLAIALEGEVKEKIAAGESSALEATRAELQSAQAETDFMSAQIDYEDAVEDFRSSLAYDETEGQGVFPDPKSLSIGIEGFKVPPNAMQEIRNANPDIKVAKIAKQIAGVDLELARKGTLPTLALSMSYGNTTPGHGWTSTAAEALRPNDRTYSVGLTFTQVLFNDSSRNVMQQAAVSKQKAEFAADQAERTVIKEYNALIKKLDIGGRRHRIAKISREIAEKKLGSEYERFKVGETSVRAVIDSQTEVNTARIAEIAARIEMILGYGKLRGLQGKLPDGLTLNFEG